MCAVDKVWITESTLIHKSIRQVRTGTLILKIIGQLPIKTIMPVGFAVTLAIMSVSTFKTGVILYINKCIFSWEPIFMNIFQIGRGI
jgi:hypothetical protein